ncbi:hypothetical protein QE412_002611 [Microbacterium trichothecenolyticum]|uniref:Uncharacterized protein n=1 Tax=Microbacterium trichothecenolyticum TaxID=69370 RepID=A0ABU0TWK0_MICTR|nr:hypothetical protein [Microbacterium trichothecenolyticum]
MPRISQMYRLAMTRSGANVERRIMAITSPTTSAPAIASTEMRTVSARPCRNGGPGVSRFFQKKPQSKFIVSFPRCRRANPVPTR